MIPLQFWKLELKIGQVTESHDRNCKSVRFGNVTFECILITTFMFCSSAQLEKLIMERNDAGKVALEEGQREKEAMRTSDLTPV